PCMSGGARSMPSYVAQRTRRVEPLMSRTFGPQRLTSFATARRYARLSAHCRNALEGFDRGNHDAPAAVWHLLQSSRLLSDAYEGPAHARLLRPLPDLRARQPCALPRAGSLELDQVAPAGRARRSRARVAWGAVDHAAERPVGGSSPRRRRV